LILMAVILLHCLLWGPGGAEAASIDRKALPPGASKNIPAVDEALAAAPMLGRPTDTSITVSLLPARPGTFFAECGRRPDSYEGRSESYEAASEKDVFGPVEIVFSNLSPDASYNYRVMFVESGAGPREVAAGRFHTQRAPGEKFVFSVQADSHLNEILRDESGRKVRLYARTLRNVSRDSADFHIDMGDFAGIEWYTSRSPRSLDEARARYSIQRKMLGIICHSVPFYLVLGNHEGEQGWRREREVDSLEVFGTLARKALIPNPSPNGFYTGNREETECCGLREDYYAWQWGDALFVVLDPFWYTVKMPHAAGGYESTDDAWDWTLGLEQYNWLYDTLHASNARWKFVFCHHVTGGYRYMDARVFPYGRGGTPVAKYKVAGEPSFEWGGEDENGEYVFEEKRPGWNHGPVHDMMVEEGVDIFFHGHDHVFVHETLDGIVYQECPQPANTRYNAGFYEPEFYRGEMMNNSGHLRVRVSPDSVRVAYVRSVLPEDEPLDEADGPVINRDVSYSYLLTK
jgi:hypothetical protein